MIGEEYEVEVYFFLFFLIFKVLMIENFKLVYFDFDGCLFCVIRNKFIIGIL